MYETLEYIDAYFQQTLSAEERAQFEVRCVNEEDFAHEVAFYVAARGAVRDTLLQQKQETWLSNATKEKPVSKQKTIGKLVVLKWLPYAAAACIVFFITAYFIFYNSTPERLSASYINDKYGQLYQTMDASRDSMKLGIVAYNDKYYQQAINLFEGVLRNDPANTDAKTYAGLAYYKIKNYDKALLRFDELSAEKTAHNMGDFLKAATLLQRGEPGDKETAKLLLEKVDKENEDGKDKAEEWLAKW